MSHDRVGLDHKPAAPERPASAARTPAAPAVANMLSLQRAAGNRAARQTLSRCACGAMACGHQPGEELVDELRARR
jgi:hypothetical protein